MDFSLNSKVLFAIELLFWEATSFLEIPFPNPAPVFPFLISMMTKETFSQSILEIFSSFRWIRSHRALRLLCLIVAIGGILPNTYAQDQILTKTINIGIGHSRDDIEIQRLGLRKDINLLFCSDLGCLTGYYEASLSYWERGNDKISGVAFSPVFVYYFGSISNSMHPYLDAGIGGAIISDTKIGNRNLSSNLHFENRIGFGLRGTDYDVNFRYLHYSNAGLKQPNDGIDILMISLGVGIKLRQ
jgi:lipid A 3-O-deacylase